MGAEWIVSRWWNFPLIKLSVTIYLTLYCLKMNNILHASYIGLLRLNGKTANAHSFFTNFWKLIIRKKNILTYKFQCLPFKNVLLNLNGDQNQVLVFSTLLFTSLYARLCQHAQIVLEICHSLYFCARTTIFHTTICPRHF